MKKSFSLILFSTVLIVLITSAVLLAPMSRSQANYIIKDAIEHEILIVKDSCDMSNRPLYIVLKSDFDNNPNLKKALEIKESNSDCYVEIIDDGADY